MDPQGTSMFKGMIEVGPTGKAHKKDLIKEDQETVVSKHLWSREVQGLTLPNVADRT